MTNCHGQGGPSVRIRLQSRSGVRTFSPDLEVDVRIGGIRMRLTSARAGMAIAFSLLVAAAPSAHASYPAPKAGTAHYISGVNSINGLSCPRGHVVTASNCMAALMTKGSNASEGISLVHNGLPGAAKAEDPGGLYVSCPSVTTCVLSGSGQSLEWIVNGQPAGTADITGMEQVGGLVCTSTTTCLVIGTSMGANFTFLSEVALVTKGGTATAHHVSGVAEFLNVSCETAHKCVAVGETTGSINGRGVVVTLTDGKAGTVHKVSGTWMVGGVSCGSSATCLSVAETYSAAAHAQKSSMLIISNGVPGKLRPMSTPYGGFSCWTGSDCLGVGAHGALARIHNGVVVSHSSTSKFVTFAGVSCPTYARCLVAGLATGSRWGVMLVTP